MPTQATISVKQFLESETRNRWLKLHGMQVYVRKSWRYLTAQNPRVLCFDIANIQVQERYRGKGLFTAWLAEAEKLVPEHDISFIYVESILETRLISFLSNQGYKLITVGKGPPSMWKHLPATVKADKMLHGRSVMDVEFTSIRRKCHVCDRRVTVRILRLRGGKEKWVFTPHFVKKSNPLERSRYCINTDVKE